MSPREIVGCIDFRYITDALTPDEALAMLERQHAHERSAKRSCCATAIPPTRRQPAGSATRTTRCGALCREALAEGWPHFKVKVGGEPADDARRVRLVREAIGPDCTLMIDANQRWDVDEAIARVRALSRFNLWWIEEPTSPDDVLGHATIAKGVAPIGVATGEHAANRVIFKQLLQATAISFCQIDSCRLGGVNENLAVILMAAKFGVPLCPHAGGVGLCELVQHLSMFDYVARVRADGRSGHRVRRPPARALRRPDGDSPRALLALRNVPATAARCTPHRSRSIAFRTDPPGGGEARPAHLTTPAPTVSHYRPDPHRVLRQRMTASTDRGRAYAGHRSTASNPSGRPPRPVQLAHEGHGRRPVSMFGPERGHDAGRRYLSVDVTAGPRGTWRAEEEMRGGRAAATRAAG